MNAPLHEHARLADSQRRALGAASVAILALTDDDVGDLVAWSSDDGDEAPAGLVLDGAVCRPIVADATVYGMWVGRFDGHLSVAPPEAIARAAAQWVAPLGARGVRTPTLQPRVPVAFERLVVPTAVSDAAGTYVAVNDAMRQLLGRREHELVGLHYAAVTDPRDRAIDADATARMQGGEDEVTIRKRLLHADGHRIDVEATLVVLRDTGGGWLGTLAQYRPVDVAARQFQSAAQRVFDAIPIGVALFDLEQRFRAVNPAMAALDHVPVEAHAGRHVTDVFAAPYGTSLVAALERVAATGEPELDVPFDAWRDRDGSARHLQASWMPIRNDDGDVFATALLVVDVTDRANAEEAERRRRKSLEALVAALPIPVGLIGDDGRYRMVNDAAQQLMGIPAALHLGRTVGELYPAVIAEAIDRLHELDGDGPQHLTVSTRGRGGEPIDIRLTGFDVPHEGWGVAVIDDTELHSSRRRVQVLSEIATRLSSAVSALDLARIAEDAFRTELGTKSTSTVRTEGNELRFLTMTGHHPDTVARWERFDLDAGIPVAAAMRAGQSLWVDTREELLTSFPDAREDALLSGVHSVGVVPLRSGRTIIGALVMTWGEDRPTTSAERRWCEGVASVLSQSLVRAMRTEHDRHIADVLQQSLLPRELRAPDWLSIAAAYRAAGGGTVGGDTYDAIPLCDGSVAIVVADVCGRGLDIAADAAATRHALRAELLAGHTPEEALATTDLAVASLDGSLLTLATAAVVIVRPPVERADGTLVCPATVTLAGQPPAVLRGTDGVRLVGAPGTMLGLGLPSATRTTVPLDLAVGDVLVCYTDGLTDTPRPRLDDASLLELVRRSAGVPVGHLPDWLLDGTAVPVEADFDHDDTAVLAVSIAPAAAVSSRGR